MSERTLMQTKGSRLGAAFRILIEQFRCSRYNVDMPQQGSNKGGLPNQPISLKVLGAYLDLSPATISLVLNNAPGVRSIPQETRDRVIAAAKKFDYRPSFYARSLRKRQSFSIGVLVPELSDGYSVLILDGIEEVLLEEGYFYLTASHRRKADLIQEYPGLLMERSVEGFIAIDTALQHPLSLPVVAIANHRIIEGVTNIVIDHRRAAELALRHLYDLGHRQIAFMRGQTFSSDSDDRWKYLMAVAKELGLEVRPELVVQLEVNISSPELGYPVVERMLAAKVPFTALISYNDIAAIGAVRAFRDRGIRVPEDVSIIGFDDIQSAAYQNPSLTTIRQPLRQMGTTAARILLKRLQGAKDIPDELKIIPELIIRESTRPPQKTKPRARKK